MTGPYDDIVNLPHPSSTRHPRMSAIDRAAQFSPFAALSGHEAAVKETARLTDQRVELTEDKKTELDMKLRLIGEHLAEHPEVSITYFQADAKKDGGSYKTTTNAVKKIDDFLRIVILTDGEQIPIDDIYEINSELLSSLFILN
ncbi:hypothetical protein [Pseudoflavonifractor phocaeensis]|uniref:hypothetical protein n=1 Tax=Pseudoflavonifractor phocaeensis TaxID=1870988 RepID=UPI00210DA5B4|nr:hypothetical protein [Pseudoflavonifractor phocaeensis]MCQ4864951.1 hypothetical protein [Pseudoflavonifractor phocaeensis]